MIQHEVTGIQKCEMIAVALWCSCVVNILYFHSNWWNIIAEMKYIPKGPCTKTKEKQCTKRHSQSPQYVESPYVVSWLWHWLCCSVDPLQRCYRPAGTCNRYCCPPDPWWVLKFYSPLSWSHWLCLASASHPSTATKNTQQIQRLYIIGLLNTCICTIVGILFCEWIII